MASQEESHDLATQYSPATPPTTPPVPTTQDEGEELLTTTQPRTSEEDMRVRVAVFQNVLSHLVDAATAWLVWLDPDESRIRTEVDNLVTTIERFRETFRSHIYGASEEYSSELASRFHQLQLRVMALTTGHADKKLKRRRTY